MKLMLEAPFLNMPSVYAVYSESGYSIRSLSAMIVSKSLHSGSDGIMKMHTGKQIKKARNVMGMTGEQLAERCDISTTYLRQLEGGKKTPSIQTLCAICRELRVPPDYLLPEVVPGEVSSEQRELLAATRGMEPAMIRAITSAIKAIRSELE